MPSGKCCGCAKWIKKPNRNQKRSRCLFLCSSNTHFVCGRCSKITLPLPRNCDSQETPKIALPQDASQEPILPLDILAILASPGSKRGRPPKDPTKLKPNTVFKKLKTEKKSLDDQVKTINHLAEEYHWKYKLESSIKIVDREKEESREQDVVPELMIKKMAYVKIT